MRKGLIVVAVVVVALAAVVAVAATNLDRWLNANRGLLAERAESALGREVDFGEIGLSFHGGLGVRVNDVRVGEDPALAKDDFVRADSVDVLVRIWPALFGSIEVERVVLNEPTVTVIRTEQGLSIDSLGGDTDAPADADAPDAAGSAPPALLVALLDVRDGTVRVVDRTTRPPSELSLVGLDVRATGLGLDEPVEFEIDAGLFSDADNLSVSGRVGPLSESPVALEVALGLDPLPTARAIAVPAIADALPEGLALDGPLSLRAKVRGHAESLAFDASIDAGDTDVRLGEGFAKARGVPMELELRGSRAGDALELEAFDLRVAEAELAGRAKLASIEKTRGDFAVTSKALPLAPFGAGEPGEVLREVDVKGELAGERISAQLRSPSGLLRGTEYRDLVADVTMAGGKIELEQSSVAAYGGSLQASGSYDTSAAQPRFDVRTRVERVRIEQLLASRSPGLARLVNGELETQLDLRGSGSAWEQIRQLLTGEGSLRISEGVLKSFNPAGDALRLFGPLLQLSDSGVARFLSAHPRLFGVEDTPFREIASKIRVRDGWVLLPNFRALMEDYELRGRDGIRYALTHDLDLPIDVVLSQPLSEEAVAAARELRYLREADGRVAFPLQFSGIPPAPSVDPRVASRLASQIGAGILVDKLLGPGAETQAGTTEDGEEAAPTRPADPTDALIREGIRRGLGGLLGGSDRQEAD